MPGMHAKATKPEVVNDADTLHDALSLVAVVGAVNCGSSAGGGGGRGGAAALTLAAAVGVAATVWKWW